MKEEKYSIGQEVYLVHINIKKDQKYFSGCAISKYVINGATFERQLNTSQKLGEALENERVRESVTYRLADSEYINAISEIGEYEMDLIFGLSVEEAKEKAHKAIDGAIPIYKE